VSDTPRDDTKAPAGTGSDKTVGAQGAPAPGRNDALLTQGHDVHQPEAAPPGLPTETIGVRRGMFGVHDGGDTTGYGGLVRRIQLPGSTERPFGGWFDEVADALERAYPDFGDAIERVVVDRGEITVLGSGGAAARGHADLRDDAGAAASRCASASAACTSRGRGPRAARGLPPALDDPQPADPGRGACPDADPHIPSVVSVYPTNDWHERETWDFFGIIFDGHPALTRIEMPDDWPGHPQRKDYPLGGVPVEYKGAQIPPPDERRSYS
jgi:NADH-quinone oxidoreductase subunit C